ncbi:MAG: DUF3391 domain-containing protein, partial [Geminicoccales bacterium]
MKKRIPVQELELGMYVGELDRPWLGTPFLYQGFVVRTQSELDELRKYCREVTIDTEKADAAAAALAAGVAIAGLPGTGRVVHRESVAVEVEWP